MLDIAAKSPAPHIILIFNNFNILLNKILQLTLIINNYHDTHHSALPNAYHNNWTIWNVSPNSIVALFPTNWNNTVRKAVCATIERTPTTAMSDATFSSPNPITYSQKILFITCRNLQNL